MRGPKPAQEGPADGKNSTPQPTFVFGRKTPEKKSFPPVENTSIHKYSLEVKSTTIKKIVVSCRWSIKPFILKNSRRILSCSLQALQTAVKVHPTRDNFKWTLQTLEGKWFEKELMGKWKRKCWQTKMYVEENTLIPIQWTRRKPWKLWWPQCISMSISLRQTSTLPAIRSSSVSTPGLMKDSTLQSYLSIASQLISSVWKIGFQSFDTNLLLVIF